jgi:hypothetical protein
VYWCDKGGQRMRSGLADDLRRLAHCARIARLGGLATGIFGKQLSEGGNCGEQMRKTAQRLRERIAGGDVLLSELPTSTTDTYLRIYRRGRAWEARPTPQEAREEMGNATLAWARQRTQAATVESLRAVYLAPVDTAAEERAGELATRRADVLAVGKIRSALRRGDLGAAFDLGATIGIGSARSSMRDRLALSHKRHSSSKAARLMSIQTTGQRWRGRIWSARFIATATRHGARIDETFATKHAARLVRIGHTTAAKALVRLVARMA